MFEKDMHIDEPSSESGLYMGWVISAYLVPITIVVMAISRYISNFKISNSMIFVLSLTLSFVWQYIWNKVHVEMHNSLKCIDFEMHKISKCINIEMHGNWNANMKCIKPEMCTG